MVNGGKVQGVKTKTKICGLIQFKTMSRGGRGGKVGDVAHIFQS
jgi:hypothetical protein